jgi:hypothetical protein
MEYKKYKTSNDNKYYFTERSTTDVKVQTHLSHKKPLKKDKQQQSLNSNNNTNNKI